MQDFVRARPGWFGRHLDRLIILFGFLGFVLFFTFYDQAFPTAAIDLRLSRAEVMAIAEQSVETMTPPTVDLSQYESGLRFREGRIDSIYLQQILGIPEANRRIKAEKLPLYRWYGRWFRPQEQEEFSISIAPTGEVISYSHTIPEAQSGAQLSLDEAQTIAESYLANDRGWQLSNWELINRSSSDKPGGRRDHFFEWKKRDFQLGESELRLSVGIQGDRLGSYSHWLKVPQQFVRDFNKKQNLAQFVDDFSSTLGVYGLLAVAFVTYVVAVLKGRLDWRSGFAPIGVLVGISILANLNRLPLVHLSYSTTQNYVIFWLQRIYNIFVGPFYSAVSVFFLWGGGIALAKRVWPNQDKILQRSSAGRAMDWARSAGRGIFLGGICMGYVLAFYFLATQLLGGWSPMGTSYSNLFATPLPFLSGLQSGFIPGIWEEASACLVGIALILWLTRKPWLALLIPGGLWAFAHVSYVRDPFWLRGIEIWIPAVFLYGAAFLRFDLVTTIFAHATFNSMLTAVLLLRSQDPNLFLSGMVIPLCLLAPTVPGLWQRWRHPQRNRQTQPELRGLIESDVAALQALNPQAWNSAWNSAKIGFVFWHQTKPVAFAIGEIENHDQGLIRQIYVDPVWRNRGYGNCLLDALKTALHQQGAKTMLLTLESGNGVGRRFLANRGWVINQTQWTESSVQRECRWPAWLTRWRRRKL